MVAGLVLVALVLSAAAAGRWGRPATPALALSSVAWLLANQQLEGPVLLVVTESHGLVAADLGGLAGLALAVWIFRSPRGD